MIVGDYELLDPLGGGAMGVVSRARRLSDGALVAVKQLVDPSHAVRFEIEARLLARLDHPRVVRVLDHFVADDGTSHLVMELVAGTDLRALLAAEGGPGLSVDRAVRFAREACEALVYVHEQGIVHRDVKPQNLIAGAEGVVLVDFGVAREGTDTEEGTVGVGTPRYMAPEVLAGGVVSPRSDVYGLAATLWTLIAGSPPRYGGETSLAEVVPDIPPALDAVVRAGLRLDPGERLASATAFARGLGATIEAAGGASLALTVERPRLSRHLLESVVRSAAGLLDSTAVSIALADPDRTLSYEAAWGAGAEDVVGLRLAPGVGVASAVLHTGEPEVVPDCRADDRFAERVAALTGYVPHTMLVLPITRRGTAVGVLALLDRADGRPYGAEDLPRAAHVVELVALSLEPELARLEGATSIPAARP